MIIYKENGISFFFGDAQSCPVERMVPEFKDFCVELTKKPGCPALVIQDQIHGVEGRYLDAQSTFTKPVSLYETQGDYLITDQPGVGIGVLTADCLPLILFDKRNNVVAVVHAGWKSALAGITVKTIEHMLKKHFFNPADLFVYVGACAKACCYEVQADFVDRLAGNPLKDQVLIRRSGKIFFDLPLFNRISLIDLGIDPRNINVKFNDCTMCNKQYHSNRRNGHARLCQMTAVWL